MPKKNLYLRSSDVDVMKRAEEIAQSEGVGISQVVVSQLQQYIEDKEIQAQGMKRTPLSVGNWTILETDHGVYREPMIGQAAIIKFTGRLLAQELSAGLEIKVFQTLNNNFIVWWMSASSGASQADYIVSQSLPDPGKQLHGMTLGLAFQIPGQVIEQAEISLAKVKIVEIE